MKKCITSVLALLLALALCLPALAQSTDGVLRKGDAGTEVATVQNLLAGLGYYNIDISGEYDTYTVNAVKAFQKNNYLTVDGKVGPKTLEELHNPSAVRASVKSTQNSTSDIITVQTLLAAKGFYTGEITGEFDKATIAAIKAFQKANGLKVDGAVGPLTLAALSDSSSTSASDVTEATEVLLKFGSKGPKVEQLQQELKDTYYYAGSITGDFDAATQGALVAFQASAGLTQDGKLGNATMNALYSRQAAIFNGGIPVRSLSTGSRGWDVLVLQEKMATLGYYTGSMDGYYSNTLAAAVKAFQKDNELTQSGSVSAAVRAYIWPAETDSAIQPIEDEETGTASYPKLQLNSHGSYVRKAQMYLRAAGALQGNVDGVFGKATENAVKAFQTSVGLKSDGVIGTETWAELLNVSLTSMEPGTGTTEEEEVVVRPDDTGENVITVQTLLNALGYNVAIDGKYGPRTTAAVTAFQKANGLKVDGKAGPSTLSAMRRLSSAGDTTGTETTVSESILRPGDKGTAVRRLQTKLRALGYKSVRVDGVYGPKTEAAVLDFQKKNGLKQDGKAGPNTFVVLNAKYNSLGT